MWASNLKKNAINKKFLYPLNVNKAATSKARCSQNSNSPPEKAPSAHDKIVSKLSRPKLKCNTLRHTLQDYSAAVRFVSPMIWPIVMKIKIGPI